MTTSVMDYKAKVLIQTVASELKRLGDLAQQIEFNELHDAINNQLQRIDSESFSVAIIGEFKRGKSTFINALLGDEILPSDVVPTTATLNKIVYSPEVRVGLRFRDGSVKTIVPEELANYVTKLSMEAENMARQIDESIIYYPIPQCQSANQFVIVDTPGLNDDADMTAVTLRGLQSCDVAIMLIMADSPFSQSEESFLHDYLLNSHLGQLVFVVNGIDRLRNANDVERVLNLVETRINASILKWIEKQDTNKTEIYLRKYGKPKVFPISALQALQAKQQQNDALLQASGFLVFEQELTRIFNQERLGILSQVAVNQTLSAANTMLTRISQDLPLLKSNQNQEHQLHELLSTECDKVKQYLSSFDQILNNIKKDSQQLQDSFKKKLRASVNNRIDSTVDEFFAGKNDITDFALLFSSQSINDLCAAVTSTTLRAITSVVDDSGDVQRQIEDKARHNLLHGKDALKDWALELFEEITLRFAPKLESTELENLHRAAADILRKVTEFRETPFSSASLFLNQSEQSVFPKNLPTTLNNIPNENISLTSEDDVGVIIIVTAIITVTLVLIVGGIMTFFSMGHRQIEDSVPIAAGIGVLLGVLFGLRAAKGEKINKAKAHKIGEYKSEFKKNLNLDSFYNTMDNYLATSFEPVDKLQTDIQSDIASLLSIIENKLAIRKQREEEFIAKQQQRTTSQPELTKIRQQTQRLSDQLEPIIRGG